MKDQTTPGVSNPDTEPRRPSGAAHETEDTTTALLGSMGGKRYGPKSETPSKPEPAGESAAVRTDTGLLGSMGGVSYREESTGGKEPEKKEPSQPAPKEAGLAGSMGGVRYGIRIPPSPPRQPAPENEPEEKRTDKSLVLAAVVTALALAASVILVFWSTFFGSAELYTKGIGGFINYTEPVEEEDVLEQDGVSYVGDQMVIVSGMDYSYDEMEEFLKLRDWEIVGYVELIDTYQVRLDRAYTLDELHSMVKEMEKDPHVDSATVNAVRENTSFLAPSDPWDRAADWTQVRPGSANWGVMAIRAPQSWERWEPEVVRVGVIDSVFEEDNPDLNFVMTKHNDIFPYVSNVDDKTHGTHVSGTIGAIHNNNVEVAGVAENCELYGYSSLRFESTIDEVSSMAELAAQDVRVFNYSMGFVPTLRDEAMAHNGMEREIYYHYSANFAQAALEHLVRKGYDFVLVCSAGNDPVSALWCSEFTYIEAPEIRDRILVVGAVGLRNDGSYYQAPWSARGERVDVLAPGVDVYSTIPGGGAYYSGTSMAAPHVTGVCASVWAIAPELSGADVKRIVVSTANTVVPGGDAKMINMYAAMAAAEAERP